MKPDAYVARMYLGKLWLIVKPKEDIEAQLVRACVQGIEGSGVTIQLLDRLKLFHGHLERDSVITLSANLLIRPRKSKPKDKE